MSKVDRFWSHDAQNIRCVRESDYDALNAELAALKAGHGEVAAVIGFYENEREPRLLSWNVLPNGEHRLYIAPPTTGVIEPDAVPARRGLLELIEQSWRVPNGYPASVPEHVEALIENGLRELRALLAQSQEVNQ